MEYIMVLMFESMIEAPMMQAIKQHFYIMNYSTTPVTWTLKGNDKQFEIAGIRVIRINQTFNLPC